MKKVITYTLAFIWFIYTMFVVGATSDATIAPSAQVWNTIEHWLIVGYFFISFIFGCITIAHIAKYKEE